MERNIWNSIESKWLQIWEKNAINASDPIAGQKKFFITVAYPYPNSPQHIGHGRTYTSNTMLLFFCCGEFGYG